MSMPFDIDMIEIVDICLDGCVYPDLADAYVTDALYHGDPMDGRDLDTLNCHPAYQEMIFREAIDRWRP